MVGFLGGGTSVGTATLNITGDASGAEAAIGQTEKRLFSFATTVRGAGIQMQLFGRGVLNMVGNVVGTFITFEDAFVGVTRTVNATEEEFALLEKGLRSMALVIPVAASDLADIMKIAGQMGIRGVENLLVFTETVARMRDVTDLTAESAAFAFARISTIMQEPIENVDRLGSTIVELGNTFATTEPLITDAAVRATGAAKTLGLSTSEMLGIVAQATVVMPRAQSAGSSLTRIWVEMADAAFTGGTSLETFANLMGLTNEETAALIQQNPAEAFKAFIKGMGGAIDAGENWVGILDDVNLNGIRTRELVLNLAGNYPELARAIATATGEWEENNALTEESERRYATLSSQLGLFRNLLTEINIIMGKALSPAIKEVTDRLKPMFLAIRDFLEAHPDLTAILLGLAAAFGALAFAAGTALIIAAVVQPLGLLFSPLGLTILLVLGLVAGIAALVIFFPEIKAFFENLPTRMQIFAIVLGVIVVGVLALAVAFLIAGPAAALFGIIMAIAFSPITLIVIGILLLIAAIGALIFFWPQISAAIMDFVDIVVKFFTQTVPRAFGDFVQFLKRFGIGIRNTLKDFGVDIRNKLKEFGLGILSFLVSWFVKIRNKLKEFGVGIKNTLREKFDQLITPVIEAFQAISETVSFWFGIIKTIFVTAFNIYKTILLTEFNIIRAIFQTAFNIIKEVVMFFVGVIRDNWNTIMSIIRLAIGIILIVFIIPWFNRLKTIFTVGWTSIRAVIQFTWDLIVPMIVFAINFIKDSLIFWFETIKNIFQVGWTVISSIVNIVWTIIKNLVLAFVSAISSTIVFWMAILRGDWEAAWNAIKTHFSRVWGLIKDTAVTIGREIKDIVLGIWDGIKTQTKTTWDLIKNTVLGALRGMRDTGKVILNGFISIFESALNFIIRGINSFGGKVNNVIGFINDLAGIIGVPSISGIPNISEVSFDRLARGGLALSPTLAVVGDVPELIIPLNKLGSMGIGQQNYYIDQLILQGDPQEGLEALGLSVSNV